MQKANQGRTANHGNLEVCTSNAEYRSTSDEPGSEPLYLSHLRRYPLCWLITSRSIVHKPPKILRAAAAVVILAASIQIFPHAFLSKRGAVGRTSGTPIRQQVARTAAAGTSAAHDAEPIEQGKFRLHKFEQPIGEETYQFNEDADSLVVKMDFKFTDRGTDVPLSAMFRSTADLTPESFEIKGKTSRQSTIDEDVEVFPDKVRLRDREKTTESALPPKQFFTIAGYAPVTMQMLLVRYWESRNSPAELTTLPGGSVKIKMRGKDSISIDG